jgi:fructose/tagatose bisphosphate aldolase
MRADAIHLGVAKFNFGTVLKQGFLAAMKGRLEKYAEPMNPHPFLGMGGARDVMTAGRAALAAEVRKILVDFGSARKSSSDTMLTSA